MPPRKGSKKAAGLVQPTLSFQTQRKSSLDSIKSQSTKPQSRSKSIQSGGAGTTKSKLRSTFSDPSLDSPVVSDDETVVHDIEIETRSGKENDGMEKRVRKELDGNGKEWSGLMKMAEKAMDGKPIHAGPDTHTKVHHILRVFDLTASYGPCVGMTRLQRWERAKKWGLNPPEEIYEILITKQGEEDESYRENVLHAWV